MAKQTSHGHTAAKTHPATPALQPETVAPVEKKAADTRIDYMVGLDGKPITRIFATHEECKEAASGVMTRYRLDGKGWKDKEKTIEAPDVFVSYTVYTLGGEPLGRNEQNEVVADEAVYVVARSESDAIAYVAEQANLYYAERTERGPRGFQLTAGNAGTKLAKVPEIAAMSEKDKQKWLKQLAESMGIAIK